MGFSGLLAQGQGFLSILWRLPVCQCTKNTPPTARRSTTPCFQNSPACGTAAELPHPLRPSALVISNGLLLTIVTTTSSSTPIILRLSTLWVFPTPFTSIAYTLARSFLTCLSLSCEFSLARHHSHPLPLSLADIASTPDDISRLSCAAPRNHA